MFKKTLTFLLIFLSIAFSYFQVDSIEESSDSFTQISEAFPVNYGNFGSVYVVDADSSKIYVYDFSLQSKGTIPIYIRLVDDIYVENINGTDNIYTLNTGDLRRVYPSIYVYNSDENDNQDKRPDIYGGTSVIKKDDYFYITHFSGKIAKYDLKGLVIKEQRFFKEEPLPKMFDSEFVDGVYYTLGETGIYSFDQNLEPISKCYIQGAKSISYFDGSFVVVTEYGVKLISVDCKPLALYEDEKNLSKIYIINENKAIGFNDKKLYLINGKFLSLKNKLDEKFSVLESLGNKLIKTSLEKIENAKLLVKEEKYGAALSLIEEIKITETQQKEPEAEKPKESKTDSSQKTNEIKQVDNSSNFIGFFQLIIIIGIGIALLIVLLLGLKKAYEIHGESQHSDKYSFGKIKLKNSDLHKTNTYKHWQEHMHKVKEDHSKKKQNHNEKSNDNENKNVKNEEKPELKNIHPRKYALKEEHKDKYNYRKK